MTGRYNVTGHIFSSSVFTVLLLHRKTGKSKKARNCTCQQKLDTQILRLDMGKRNYGQGMRKPVQAIRHLLTEPERNAGHKCRR